MNNPDDDNDPVTDGLTALMSSAAMAHEMFLSYVAAGFTEPQAIYLVAQILTAGLRTPGT